MRTAIRYCGLGILSVTLLAPFGTMATSALAQDKRDEQRREAMHRYHDARHKDDHEWNDREDRAYHMWAEQNHRKNNSDFEHLRARDQQSYWNWRHNHSDQQLRIDIR